jgi:hypothetical protein
MSKRAARLIRQGILDARRRIFPYWSVMGAVRRARGWENPRQPNSELYRIAFERTAARLPRPLPPRGRSGIGVPTR